MEGFAGLRDLVAHQYFGIDTSQLLPIIRDELPGLLAAVESEVHRRSLFRAKSSRVSDGDYRSLMGVLTSVVAALAAALRAHVRVITFG